MSSDDYQLKTLSRGLRVLGTIERAHQPMTLTEIAAAMDEPAPGVFRVLRTLEGGGYVRKDGKRYTAVSSGDGLASARQLILALRHLSDAGPDGSDLGALKGALEASSDTTASLLALMREAGLADDSGGRWSLSPRLLSLVRPLIADQSLMGLRNMLERLRTRTGESIGLFVRSGAHQVLVEMAPSLQPVRYVLDVGTSFPVHRGAAGRAALMPLAEAEIRTVLADAALALDPAAIDDVCQTVAQSVELGYATSWGERVEGAGAVACPVFDARGAPLAVINIMYPAFRVSETMVREFGTYLQSETRSHA